MTELTITLAVAFLGLSQVVGVYAIYRTKLTLFNKLEHEIDQSLNYTRDQLDELRTKVEEALVRLPRSRRRRVVSTVLAHPQDGPDDN